MGRQRERGPHSERLASALATDERRGEGNALPIQHHHEACPEFALPLRIGGQRAPVGADHEERCAGSADRVLLNDRRHGCGTGLYRLVAVSGQFVAVVRQGVGEDQPQPVEQGEVERAALLLFLVAGQGVN